jgi:hypothetical protein
VALGLGLCAVVGRALGIELWAPAVRNRLRRIRAASLHGSEIEHYDPGREGRAEQRARALLCSCVEPEDWAMYSELGFLRVRGRGAPNTAVQAGRQGTEAPYAYLIYPHKPIVAYVPQTSRLLSEYCVRFPDLERPYGSERLPASDDVLAKWLALTADEQQLIATANIHLAGQQVEPARVRRDLVRLSAWEYNRLRGSQRSAGSVPSS